jgi:hypothetical protein
MPSLSIINEGRVAMVQESVWLIDEARAADEAAVREMQRKLPPDRRGSFRAAQQAPCLAVRVQDLIIHDNRKWFGEANIRVDVLAVHGGGQEGKAQSFYMPRTFRFARVKDGDRLSTGDTGLVIFYGKALYFLDIFIMVSRDRSESDDLATYLSKQLQSSEIQGALGTVVGLAAAVPQVAIITAAIGAAGILGEFAYRVLSKSTGNTVGLYHNTWLQYRDRFGLGRHPKAGTYRAQDLSFWYQIILEQQGAMAL